MKILFSTKQKVIASTILLMGLFSRTVLADEENEQAQCVTEDECVGEDAAFATEAFGIRIPSVREIGDSVSGGLKNARDGVAQALNDAGKTHVS